MNEPQEKLRRQLQQILDTGSDCGPRLNHLLAYRKLIARQLLEIADERRKENLAQMFDQVNNQIKTLLVL